MWQYKKTNKLLAEIFLCTKTTRKNLELKSKISKLEKQKKLLNNMLNKKRTIYIIN